MGRLKYKFIINSVMFAYSLLMMAKKYLVARKVVKLFCWLLQIKLFYLVKIKSVYKECTCSETTFNRIYLNFITIFRLTALAI